MKITFDVDLGLAPKNQEPMIRRKVQTAFANVRRFFLRELSLIDLEHSRQIQVQITAEGFEEVPPL